MTKPFKRPSESVTQLREAWLNDLAQLARPHMEAAADLTFPAFRVSCGFPSRGGASGKVVGQCWSASASTDKHAEIFINPVEDKSEAVASTLIHELIHACLPLAGHKAPFARAAKAMGFKAPWKSTPETDALWAWLRPLVAQLPAYPHGALNTMQAVAAPKPQKARLLKAECGGCGYTVRVTRKWVEGAGAPLCPCNTLPMICEGMDADGADA